MQVTAALARVVGLVAGSVPAGGPVAGLGVTEVIRWSRLGRLGWYIGGSVVVRHELGLRLRRALILIIRKNTSFVPRSHLHAPVAWQGRLPEVRWRS